MRGYTQQRLTHHPLKGNGVLQIIQAPLINMIGIYAFEMLHYIENLKIHANIYQD